MHRCRRQRWWWRVPHKRCGGQRRRRGIATPWYGWQRWREGGRERHRRRPKRRQGRRRRQCEDDAGHRFGRARFDSKRVNHPFRTTQKGVCEMLADEDDRCVVRRGLLLWTEEVLQAKALLCMHTRAACSWGGDCSAARSSRLTSAPTRTPTRRIRNQYAYIASSVSASRLPRGASFAGVCLPWTASPLGVGGAST